MSRTRISSSLFVLFAFLANFASAQNPFGDSSLGGGSGKTQSETLAGVTAFKPGEPFYVALKLTHPEGWHSYYVNSASVANGVTMKWILPEGWTASDLLYPVPHKGIGTDGKTAYDYGGANYFMTRITPPVGVAAGTEIELKAEARWQICDESNCIPEPDFRDPLFISYQVVAGAEATPGPAAGEVEKAKQKLAQSSDAWEVVVKSAGNKILIDLTLKEGAVAELGDVYFFAAQENVTDANAEQTLEKTDKGYTLTVPRLEGEDALQDFKIGDLAGILKAGSGWEQGETFEGLDIAGFGTGVADASELYDDVTFGRLLGVLGLMFIGGFILNIMPCVFPVIGIKIMGFVNQAGEDKAKIMKHGLVFAAGVLTSFWILAGFLLFLREKALTGTGEAVGWGYQLQNPWMVWGILLIMFILGLSMFGLFEIGAKATSVGSGLQAKQGVTGTFFSGVLATVVATPCSAPFLGAAIGVAFALPPTKFMLAFTAMAVGLAAPYLILSAFPVLVRKLPRPGAWMESFKQGMSFLLFGTVGVLVWVYLAQNEPYHGLNVMLGLTLIATAAWVYGRWFLPSKSAKARRLGLTSAVVLLAAGLYISKPAPPWVWDSWSEEKVQEALEIGRPVYVDFTATWCVTCQVNKKVAYTDEVKDLMKNKNLLILRGDKTNPSPDIEDALKKLKRTAIPVNVLYVPGKEPIITPELLSAGYLKELFSENIPDPK